MIAVTPTGAGWYQVSRRTQRWWDGYRWGEDVIHAGHRTTATAVRRSVHRFQWASVLFGILAWVVFLTMSFTFGTSAALWFWSLPILGSAWILYGAIGGSRLIAALPPTPQEPGTTPGDGPPQETH